ncbi:Glycosyltransferase 61 [Gracilaria domingensis]|nr:Glycosyltransferase 61 [Gracilaria domingensis]
MWAAQNIIVLDNDEKASVFVSRNDGTQSKVNLNYEYEDMDVIGSNLPRGKRELLAYDMTPYIFMMEMFSGSSSSHVTFECLSGNTDSCEQYETDRSEHSSLNPLILIDARISSSKEYHWPKSLLRLIRNSVMGKLKILDMKDLYGWKVRSTASCFRSILTSNVQTGDMSPKSFTGTHRFFSLNGLSRSTSARSENSPVPCVCKVLVLNRFGKRFIIGGDILTRAITFYGKKVASIDPTVRIEAEEVFFENSSFHEQVSIIQESSIVVASHGDGNSNFMFLKPDSRVFEIMPYGYKSDIFRNIAVVYGARYEQIRSQADNEVFEACVQHYNSNKGSFVARYLTNWENNAVMFLNETIQNKRNVWSDMEIPEDEAPGTSTSLKNLRECASYQRLSVDIKDLARNVALAATQLCRVQGDVSILHQ